MFELEESIDNTSLIGMFKQTAIDVVDSHLRLVNGINNLIIKRDDQQEEDLCKFSHR